MQQEDNGGNGVRARPVRLFLGIVLSFLAPNLIYTPFMLAADLVPPFDAVQPLHPLPLLYVLAGALVAATWMFHRYRTLCVRDRRGAPPEEIRSGLRGLIRLMPMLVVPYVLIGAALQLGVVENLAAWRVGDLIMPLVLAVVVIIQVMVPLAIVALDEFSLAFGHLIDDRPLIPDTLRSLPVLLMPVMIVLVLPVYEYASTGSLSPALLVLVGTLLSYVAVVTLLNLRYTTDAIASVERFVEDALQDGPMDVGELRTQALDEVGVMVSRIRRVLARLEDTRYNLEASEARFRSFAEASSDWFFETDAEQRVTWISPRVTELTGVPAEDLLGRHLTGLKRFCDPDVRESFLADLAARRSFRDVPFTVSLADGFMHHLRVSGAPVVDAAGAFVGYRGTGTDNTHIVEAELRLRERESQLAQAQKMEAVGQLTGGIAHDFNNLLTAVTGNLELVRIRDPEFGGQPLLRDALGATRRAGELVQRLLSFSRRQELNPEPVNVRERLESTASLLRRTLGAAVVLEVDVEGADVHVMVDPVQFESALLNLSLNARDAMPGGGVLRLAATRCGCGDCDSGARAARCSRPGDMVRVSVIDTGMGIDAGALDHVFEPFFSTKPTGAGSGLGLSMVDNFVRQSGGTVRIDSERGVGTRIEMQLPRARAPGATAVPEPEPVAVEQAPPERVVLVVEDEPSVRQMVTGALDVLGYRSISVEDGDTALACLPDLERLDAVLSDVVLPGEMSGVDVVRHVRAEYPEVPCLLMSGYARGHLSDEGEDLPDLPLLKKPFRLAELRRMLEEVIHRSGVRDGSDTVAPEVGASAPSAAEPVQAHGSERYG